MTTKKLTEKIKNAFNATFSRKEEESFFRTFFGIPKSVMGTVFYALGGFILLPLKNTVKLLLEFGNNVAQIALQHLAETTKSKLMFGVWTFLSVPFRLMHLVIRAAISPINSYKAAEQAGEEAKEKYPIAGWLLKGFLKSTSFIISAATLVVLAFFAPLIITHTLGYFFPQIVPALTAIGFSTGLSAGIVAAGCYGARKNYPSDALTAKAISLVDSAPPSPHLSPKITESPSSSSSSSQINEQLSNNPAINESSELYGYEEELTLTPIDNTIPKKPSKKESRPSPVVDNIQQTMPLAQLSTYNRGLKKLPPKKPLPGILQKPSGKKL